MIRFALLLSILWTSVFAAESLQFEPLHLGVISQGEQVPVMLQGKSLLIKPMEVEQIISQNVGPKDFEFAKLLPPDASFQIRYQLDTRGMQGAFSHRIILIEKGGTPHVAEVSGIVEAPILFSKGMLDVGYQPDVNNQEWVVYAWAKNGKALQLELEKSLQGEFSLATQAVKLDVRNVEQIKEGGSTPGLKIVLKPLKMNQTPEGKKGKSIRKLVDFVSPQFPKATPELLLIGYWK